jgi:guanyl-specific ribonuclease Sa
MSQQKPASVPKIKSQTFWIIVALLIVVASVVWQYNQSSRTAVPSTTPETSNKSVGTEDGNTSPDERSGNDPDDDQPLAPGFAPELRDHGSVIVSPVDSKAARSHQQSDSFLVKDQTIRDQHGKVVFRGTVDLKPTLDRIERGEANRHRNDGTTFQNREGRLPRKPAGYYKEYVHPTQGESGPGPQRMILGKDGEIWYTPDHYKTFLEIKPSG